MQPLVLGDIADQFVTQKALEKKSPGATIIPVIISSDKTLLTLFRNKTAYPVYLTIGNLPKDIRRKPSRQAQILIAYLPTSKLTHITNKASRKRVLANLFHSCMSKIVEPLKSAGLDGIPIASGDGVVRPGHPLYAAYVGDYPEQMLVTCCKTGECAQCESHRDEMGDFDEPHSFRDLEKVLDALGAADESAEAFVRACGAAGIKPIYHSFWEGLPYANPFKSITPDILHQLYQGVMKHLKGWIISAYGADEIDARCRRLPPNHNI